MRYIYICNGANEECRRTGCKYWTDNGHCDHTMNEKYALYPPNERKFVENENGDFWEVTDCE